MRSLCDAWIGGGRWVERGLCYLVVYLCSFLFLSEHLSKVNGRVCLPNYIGNSDLLSV